MTNRCPGCGSAADLFLYEKNGCGVFCCPACGTGLARPTSFDPACYYSQAYFSGEEADGYANYLATAPVVGREFSGVARKIFALKKGGRLLELGCAYGLFLEQARLFFDTKGLEPVKEAVEYARRIGLDVDVGWASDDSFAALGTFDVIVMLDVIEHLPDPHATLTLCHDHLADDGVLWLTTGNFGSWLARLSGSHWRLMTPPQHLSFFTDQGIRRLAQRVGLEVIEISSPSKLVPLSLMLYQVARMIGVKSPRTRLANLGVRVNLFDAMQVVMRKARSYAP